MITKAGVPASKWSPVWPCTDAASKWPRRTTQDPSASLPAQTRELRRESAPRCMSSSSHISLFLLLFIPLMKRILTAGCPAHVSRPSYLANYEMYEILVQAENPDLYSNISTIQYEDEGDVLIYNEMNWASWLSPSSYASRRSWTDGLNFSSTSNWAVDLNQTYFNNSTGDLLSTGLEDSFDMCDYSKTFDSLDDPLSPEQFAVLRLCCLLYSVGSH